jgi:hypothetical protein
VDIQNISVSITTQGAVSKAPTRANTVGNLTTSDGKDIIGSVVKQLKEAKAYVTLVSILSVVCDEVNCKCFAFFDLFSIKQA